VVFQLGLLLPPPNHFDSLTSGPIFGVHLNAVDLPNIRECVDWGKRKAFIA
jgi:hypothetical protein